MDMVERVARAIDDATWTNFDNYAKLKGWTDEERIQEMLGSRSIQKSLSNARAAIEEMREPTLSMVAAGNERMENSTGETGLTIWWAMMDAALNPSPPSR